MPAIIAAIVSVFTAGAAFRAAVIAAFAWITGNAFKMFFVFQLIAWLISIIFTTLLAFYGSEYLSYFLDITGIKAAVVEKLGVVGNLGGSLDSSGLVSGNAFGTNITAALIYFNFFPFLNAIFSLVFGIFAVKLNIWIFKNTRAALRGPGVAP